MIRVNTDRIPIGDFAKKYGLFPFVNHHGLHYYSNSPKGNGLIVAIPDGEVIEAPEGTVDLLFDMNKNDDVIKEGTHADQDH